MGGAYPVTWTVLCFQFHTHRSLQHSKASPYIQTVADLRLSVHDFAPQGHAPFPKLRLTRVRMSEFSQPKGTEALSGLSISIRQGSSTDTQCFVAVCLNIPLTVRSLVPI